MAHDPLVVRNGRLSPRWV